MAALDNILKDIDNKADFLQGNDDSVIAKVVDKFIVDVRNNIETMGLDASGKLMASIAPMPTITENGVIKIRIAIEDYWKDVDEGTKPKGFSKENMATLLPKIQDWIKNKPSVQRLSKMRKRDTLAYLITRSILKKGTIKRFGYKGSKFLSSELPGFKENLLKVIEQQFTK